MSHGIIKELRAAGRLDEALELAQKQFNASPDNIWNKRSLAWVYYDVLKNNNQVPCYEAFKQSLLHIKELQLPDDEQMIFDSCAWQVGTFVFQLQKVEPIPYERIDELFDIVRSFHFTKPSEAYSFIFKAFHKGYKAWSRYIDFADWWGFEHFLPKDFQQEEYNSRKLMSAAEQAYIGYSKKLLELSPMNSIAQSNEVYKEKIYAYLPKLEAFIEQYPGCLYPPYFKAKLLLALGNTDDVLPVFLPFARQKRNDFWVWELLADMFPDDREIRFSCYCKALSLKTPEEFLIKLRQSFAKELIDRKLYEAAKCEIEKIVSTRSKNKWKIPPLIAQWTKQNWYEATQASSDNRHLYAAHCALAEGLLFQDMPEELIAIELVNVKKGMLNFIKDKSLSGFFGYKGYIKSPQVGELYSVRFSAKSDSGFCKILSAKPAPLGTASPAIKHFDGVVKIVPPNKFGFIQQVFLEPQFIERNKLSNGQHIKGKAILSFNKKKNVWGWKAIGLQE